MNSLFRILPFSMIFVLGLTACSLEPKSKYARLHLSLLFPEQDSDRSDAFENPVELLATSASSPVWEKAAPTTAASFPCYGVNVIGPGIADTSANPERNFNFNALLTRQSYCTYRGIVAGPFYPGSGPIDVSLQIPVGSQRIVQVVGVTPAAACPTAFLPSDSGGGSDDVYELGRVVADVFSDRSFSIPKEYPEGGSDADRAGRLMDCGGGGACTVTSGGASESGGLTITSSNPGAQRLVVTQSTYLKQIDLYFGNPFTIQNVTVSLRSDSSGNPGSVVDAVRAVSTTPVPAASAQWTTFNFGTPGDYLLLSPGTYWIVATPTTSSVVWHSGASGSPGQAKLTTGVGWTASSRVSSPAMAALSGQSTCVISGGGFLSCAGYNNGDVFGDGFASISTRPFFGATNVLAGATQVTISDTHGCALNGTGTAYCWGTNTSGQMGNSSNTSSTIPLIVSSLGAGVQKISAGSSHTCAVNSSGEAYCWGNNAFGSVGDNTTVSRNVPTLVTGLPAGVTGIAAGGSHSCAIITGGVKCWGLNGSGQVGDSSTIQRNVPTTISALVSGVTSIAAGTQFSCAVQSGAAKCWGMNGFGQIGDGTNVNRTSPTQVQSLSTGVVKVVAGSQHACALTSAGSVHCWGDNSDGQLGDGTTNSSAIPVDVFGFSSGVTDIFAGVSANHTCALRSGELHCWGDNGFSQQAYGTTTSDHITPTLIRGADQFAHRFYSCGG